MWNFCTISSHESDDIIFVLEKCLEDWNLESKLYTIIVYNTGSNHTAYTILIGDFKRYGHFLFWVGNSYTLGVLFTYLIWVYGMG